MNVIRTAALALLLCGCSMTPHSDYGTPLTLDDDAAIEVGAVLAEPDSYDGKFLRISGTVTEVCAKKGCWLRMSGSGDAKNVFVKFNCPISGHLIPMEAVGLPVVVEGTVTMTKVSEDERRHLAEDAGKTPAQIAAIMGDAYEMRIDSPAARVFGIEQTELPPQPASQPASQPAG
ncbi:MAG: DUF4920 domain-containing protein [Planctomycetota bacterium]